MNLRFGFLLGLGCLPVVTLAAYVGRFSMLDAKVSNYEHRTHVTPSESGFSVARDPTGGEGCTAWGITSPSISLSPQSAKWTLDFDINSPREWYRVASSEHWQNAVKFYGINGNLVGREGLDIEFAPRGFVPFRFSGDVPRGAVSATVQFGIDSNPPVKTGEQIAVRKLRFVTYAPGENPPEPIVPDCQPPLVWSALTSSVPSGPIALKYNLEEQTAVDWSSAAVSDADTGERLPFAHDATSLTLLKRDWAKGLHRFSISVADTLGQTGTAHKVLLVGEVPKTRRFTLRDDGATLIAGHSFFPIGVFGIARHERNHCDYDAAIRELQAAGMNIGHSYENWKDAEFMRSAGRDGFWLWTNGKPAMTGDGWFFDVARQEPANLAWYIGDDTSLNSTPQMLLDRDEACRILDGSRLTCHADGVGASRAKSNLQDYVNFADVFMPEIYPFDGHEDERAVAEVCRDTDRCFADYAKFGRPGRSRAVWPILQCFDGASWKRYPTAVEIYATGFAAIIHGAQGILWFKYGGVKDAAHRYSGMFRTEADWTAVTNLTRRIAALSPILTERTPKQPPLPQILSGPATDPLGQPAVTILKKTYQGHDYVFAVNAAPKTVRARFVLGCKLGSGKVAWEHREVLLENGKFEDDFQPFAVHVYRF